MPATAKKRVRDDPQVRRAQILDEAIRIIGERGYYGFAVHDLAQRCGLTTGGLLYHFKTKEELFLAVLAEYERRTGGAARAAMDRFAEEAGPDGQLSLRAARSVLRALLTYSTERPEVERLFLALQAEALNASHPGHEYFSRLEQRIIGGFTQMVAGHTRDPVSAARQLYALMYGLEHQWLSSECGFDILAEWDRAVALILPDEASKGDA